MTQALHATENNVFIASLLMLSVWQTHGVRPERFDLDLVVLDTPHPCAAAAPPPDKLALTSRTGRTESRLSGRCALSFGGSMRDPWCSMLDMLTGAAPAPAARWPRERTRIVLLAVDGPDDEKADRESELSPAELEVLQLLGDRGMTAGELADALRLELNAIYARTCRMSARQLIRRDGRTWRVADASPARQNDAGRAIGVAVAGC